MIKPKRRVSIHFTVIGLLITVFVLSPVYFVFTYGFQTVEEMLRVPPYLIPPNLSLDNYFRAVSTLSRYIVNNVVIAAGCVVFTLLVAPLAAFSLSHYLRKTTRWVYLMLLVTQMFPVVMIATPLFLIYNRLGLMNTFVGLILADATYTIPFATLLLSAYFRSIPFSLVESAIIDGASHLKAFLRIIVPVGRSGIITVAIMAFLMAWSDFVFALSLTTNPSRQPISIGIYRFIGQHGANWPLVMASGFLYTIPPLVFVLFFGRYIIAGLTAGAIKQ